MKKILTLISVVALLTQFSNTQAQERLWGIASGAIFSVNKDGTDYTSTNNLGGGVGWAIRGYTKTPNGIIYVTWDDDTEEGDVGVLNQTGTHHFHHHSYLESEGSEGMTYAYDGKVYIPARSVMSSKIVGVGITDPSGTFYTRQNFTNTSFLSGESSLTATMDGVYGVSRGTSGNYGGIFKLSSDAKSIQIIHQFTAASPGTRAIGKLVEGTDGTLFGETLRGGMNDKGIYFKINKDGTNLTKIGDKADGEINALNSQGKYQRLVDFVALGYAPLRDTDGFIFINTATGVYKINNDGTPILKVTQWPGESLSFISSPNQHAVKVNNLATGSTNVSTNLNLTLDTFQGASFYEIQVSTTPDFSSGVQFQRHPVPSFNFSLAGSTTYYVRARPMTWPYFGAVISFTTETKFDLAQERLWGTRSGSGSPGPSHAIGEKIIFSIKKDGSDYMEHTVEGSIYQSGGFKKMSDGNVLTTTVVYSGGSEYVSRITKNGVQKLFDVEYMQGYTLGASMVEIGNGRLLGTEAGTGPKLHGVIEFAADGSYNQLLQFSTTKDLAPDFYLAATENGVYGVSRGDASNKGFVFRVRNDRKGVDIVYQFLGLADGKQPSGRIVSGVDNFLFGQTLRGGKNNSGIFFKVKDDGTGFTKLFDRADGEIWTRANDGKFARLLDFIAAGYTRVVSDSEGFYYLGTPAGLFKIRSDGYPEAQLSNTPYAENLALVAPTFSPETFISNIENGSSGLPTNLTLRTDSFPGADIYNFELSKSADFSTIDFSLDSPEPFIGVQGLESNTTYYSRVRPNAWPYFGNVVSFKTSNGIGGQADYVLMDATYEGVNYARTDGSNIMEMTSQENETYGEYPPDVLTLSDGDLLVKKHAVLSRLGKNGLTPLYTLDYDEMYWMQHSWVEGKDGYLYYFNYSVIGPEIRGASRLKLDGTSREVERFNVPNFHGYQPKLTAIASGIYGIDPGIGDSPGNIFRLNSDLSGIEVIYTFDGASKPQGKLLDGLDGYLYGVTRAGGQENGGVIYRINPDGSAFTIVHHFINSTGRSPVVGLISDEEGWLYGATRIGGQSGKGVIFRVARDGSSYRVLLHLNSVGGQFPDVPLKMAEDGYVYGAAQGAGFFKIDGNGDFVSLRPLNQPEAITLIAQAFIPEVSVVIPSDQSSGVSHSGTFTVSAINGASNYYLELSESPIFSGEILVFGSTSSSIAVHGLQPSTTYFARVRSGLYPFYGNVTSFTTGALTVATVNEGARLRREEAQVNVNIEGAYPNPSNYAFNLSPLKSESDKVISVIVTNANGTIVYESKNVSAAATLQFGQDLPRGVYFLKTKTQNGVKISRLVKN